jgi:hypothetical protein
MSEEQQATLLDLARHVFDKRKLPRKPCLIPAHYKLGHRFNQSFILDISDCGVYLETNDFCRIGADIDLVFYNPFSRKLVSPLGQIVWSSSLHAGIKFKHYPA